MAEGGLDIAETPAGAGDRRSPQSTVSGGGGDADGGACDPSEIQVAAAAHDRNDNDAAFHFPSVNIRRTAKRHRKEQQMEQQMKCLDPTTGRLNSRKESIRDKHRRRRDRFREMILFIR